MSDEETNEPNEVDESTPRKSGLGRGLVAAFIGAIVVVETAMFFLMVPSADQVSALAEEQLISSIEEGKKKAEEMQTEKNRVQEFELGMFGEVFSPHDTEASYRVELDLYGLIRNQNEEKMSEEFERKQGRLRNAIRMRIRNSSLEELQENNLGLLERRILTQCNHLLAEDLLLGIGFKSYQLIEQ